MAQGVLLVSETKIKNFTNTHQNVDVELLLPNIQIAQDLGLQNLLGGRYYDYLIYQVSGNTLTNVNKEFIENYVQPYLLWRAYYETHPQIYMRMMNKSIIVGDTEQGKAVTVKEMQYLREIAQSRYEFYAQRMMDQLRNFPNLYPEYYTYTTKDGMPPSRVTYFAGIHFEPGYRYPPRRADWANGLPRYYGGEYDCADCSYYAP